MLFTVTFCKGTHLCRHSNYNPRKKVNTSLSPKGRCHSIALVDVTAILWIGLPFQISLLQNCNKRYQLLQSLVTRLSYDTHTFALGLC